jgi:Icc-related predicted phosphoesterase
MSDVRDLRLVVFSDYRVQDVSLLVEFLKQLEPRPDLILYAGDDVERFHVGSTNFFEVLASLTTDGLCAVIGNDLSSDEDNEKRKSFEQRVKAERQYIQGKRVYDVHGKPRIFGEYAVIGSDGTEHHCTREQIITKHLRDSAKKVKGKKIIVLSHLPPRGTVDLGLRFGRGHKGSVPLRKFAIARKDIALIVCGHIHFCGAQEKKLGRTLVVNAASHDDNGAPGRVGIIDIQDGKIGKVKWHLLWELSSIPGVGESRQLKLLEAGIRTPQDLAAASEQRIALILKSGIAVAMELCARARSLCRQEIVVRKSLTLPTEKRAYLDIETDLEGKLIWLIGIHVDEENKSYSFYAENSSEEKKILIEMLKFFEERPKLNIFAFSGSQFEPRLLGKRLAAHGLPQTVTAQIRDIYSEVHEAFAFPCQTLGLKDIANCCGFKWRDEGMSGFTLALMYASSGKKIKRMAIRYNEDDLLSLKHVVHDIENLSKKKSVAANA